MKRVLAGIVTYNPDLERLKENINSVKNQVDELIIVDNGSSNINGIRLLLPTVINIFELGDNYGIAYALNKILEYAYNEGFEWFFTLDQDSVTKPLLIRMYAKQISKHSVAMFTCNFVDRNGVVTKKKGGYVNSCITSGSFCNTKDFHKIGGFSNDLFIDLVDIEICYRLLENGYKIYRIKNVGLTHELGNIKVINFFSKKINIFNEPPIRVYYMTRNSVYVYKKYKKKELLYSIFRNLIGIILFEKEKKSKIKRWLRGFYDGVNNKMGKIK